MGLRRLLMWVSLTVIMNCVVMTCLFLDKLAHFTVLSAASLGVTNQQELILEEELIEDIFRNNENEPNNNYYRSNHDTNQGREVEADDIRFENEFVEAERRFLPPEIEETMEEGQLTGQPKMVLVMTQSRHGSTWLMDMLGYRDEAIPVFEPLNNPDFLNMYARSADIRREAQERGFDPQKYPDWREVFLARICICDWDGIGIPGKTDDLFGTVRGLWYKDRLLNPDNPAVPSNEFEYRDQCFEKTTMMVPKTIRYYDMSTLYRVRDFGCRSFKVIHLVRDPRAVMLSRMTVFSELFDGNGVLGERMNDYKKAQYGFDEEYMVRAAEHLCSHHLDNYKLGTNPPPWLKGRYKMVRYEDLARDADFWSQQLLDFIGVEYTDKYKDYVYNITHEVETEKQEDWYGVRRQSSKIVDSWKDKLIEPHWRTIEKVCADMMRVFDYELTF